MIGVGGLFTWENPYLPPESGMDLAPEATSGIILVSHAQTGATSVGVAPVCFGVLDFCHALSPRI